MHDIDSHEFELMDNVMIKNDMGLSPIHLEIPK